MTSENTAQKPDFSIAFLGFGEAAQAFVSGLANGFSSRISAYDIKTELDAETSQAKWAEFFASGVTGCETVLDAVGSADAVFSMVTADQALAAAESVAGKLRKGALYFDCNSCAPGTKIRASEIIEYGQASYVDVAIMAPVFPKLHQTPVLVSGSRAETAVELFGQLNMNATLAEGGIGAASSIKMMRSVMIKGMEALVAECVLAGRKAGVEEIVLESLEKTFPGFGWQKRAGYMLERMMQHGTRRAAEMQEAALTVEELGIEAAMSRACVEWQQAIGDLSLEPDGEDYGENADIILAALSGAGPD